MEHNGSWPVIIIVEVIEVCLLQSNIVLLTMSVRCLGSVVMKGWLVWLGAVPDMEHSAEMKGHPLPC